MDHVAEVVKSLREMIGVYREDNGSDMPEDQPDVVCRAMKALQRFDFRYPPALDR
jgi:hypothetical protein